MRYCLRRPGMIRLIWWCFGGRCAMGAGDGFGRDSGRGERFRVGAGQGPEAAGRRTGWWMAGVRDPESVTEHSWRTSIIPSVIAGLEATDPARAALLAVWHDSQETRGGDVNHLGKKYIERPADPVAVTEDQTSAMPPTLAAMIRGVVAEYEAQESAEARCAKDADKIECMLQGLEYRSQGFANAERWIDNSRARVKTPSGQRLADELLAQGSWDWLRTAMGEMPSAPRTRGGGPRRKFVSALRWKCSPRLRGWGSVRACGGCAFRSLRLLPGWRRCLLCRRRRGCGP
ncbi:HD domain-containing protein [Murinocardiopsis flavida]